MKYGIIEASGRQYWIEEGKYIEINKIKIQSGTKILINRILFAKNKNKILIGDPYIKQISISGLVGQHILGPKIFVYKMRPKKKYRKKIGHRQHLTTLLIEKFNF